MIGAWLVLALAAAVAWGTADFLAGLAARRLPLLIVLFGVQAIGSAIVLPLWVAWSGERRLPGLAVAAGFAMVAGLAALYRGLARGPVSVVAPVAALGGAVPVGIGVLAGESLAGEHLLGVLMGLVGLSLVTWERDRDRVSPRGQSTLSALAHGLAAALALGLAVSLLGLAGEGEPLGAVVAARATAVLLLGTVVAGWLRRNGDWSLLRNGALAVAAAGILDVAATVSFALAAERGPLGPSGLVASLYPASTVLLGVVVLGERLSVLRWAGIGLILAGVALLRGAG
ncbi:EamA family transporter [Thermomicrobium sp.]